jgi:hypothetical protein
MSNGPLLVWLLGKDVLQIRKLWTAASNILHEETPNMREHMAWCMMNLVAKLGPAKLYMFEGLLRRLDMDVLAENGQEAKFLHYLFERTKAENGFEGRDVVLVWGNDMLTKLGRFQKHFQVRLLWTDRSNPEDVKSLSKELGVFIDTLEDTTGRGLLTWLEEAGMRHIHSTDTNARLFSHPLMAQTRARVEAIKYALKGLVYPDDQALIDGSMCKIAELRGLKRPEPESDSDCSFNEDGTHWGTGGPRHPKKKKSEAAPSQPPVTSDSVRAWAEANLRVAPKSKLGYTEVKEMIKKSLKTDTQISKLMMDAAGLLVAQRGSKKFVKDSEGRRLGLKPSLASA